MIALVSDRLAFAGRFNLEYLVRDRGIGTWCMYRVLTISVDEEGDIRWDSTDKELHLKQQAASIGLIDCPPSLVDRLPPPQPSTLVKWELYRSERLHTRSSSESRQRGDKE